MFGGKENEKDKPKAPTKDDKTESADEEKADNKEEGKEAEGKAAEVPPPQPVKMKQGDYVVQVHLIEARDLKGRDFGGTADPTGSIKVMGKKQTSRIHKKCASCMFDEIFYFEFSNLDPKELEGSKVTLSIFDANSIRRDVLIGMYELDLAWIYYQKNHEVFRQWCALTDVTDKFEGIQGYLKFSVVVLGPDDEQHTHTAAEEDDEESSMLAVLMPPHIEQVGKLLKIQVYEVRDLPQMDEGLFGTKCDPYARVEFAGCIGKTPHLKGQSVEMTKELQIPVMEPVMSTSIKFSVWDWDQASADDIIATTSFDYMELKSKPKGPTWVTLYGAPEGQETKKVAKSMNRGFTAGSGYRGRCLISAHVEDQKDPKLDCISILGLSDSQKPKEEKWVIQLDLYEGSEVCDKGKMFVEVCCGSFCQSSDSVKVTEGRCEWYAPMKDISMQMPADTSMVPDIFIYLCYKNVKAKQRMSFLRFPFADIAGRGWKVPPSWGILQEDPCLDLLSPSEFPGALLFSLRAGRASEMPSEPHPESRPLAYDMPPEAFIASPTASEQRRLELAKMAEQAAQPKVIFGTLKVEVVEGKNLPDVDKSSCDPFVKFKVGENGKYVSTKVIRRTHINPKWNESFTFEGVSIESQMKVKVIDKNVLKDEKMGEFVIDLRSQQAAAKVSHNSNFTLDAWFLVNEKFPNSQMRFKFEWTFNKVDDHKPIPITPTSMTAIKNVFSKKPKRITGGGALGRPAQAQYQLRAHIFQARGLTATDSSGLADPYVVVRLAGKSVKFPVCKETLNPRWTQTMAVNVTLPLPLELAPYIQVFVFDWDGLSKDDPLGRFSVIVKDVLVDEKHNVSDVRPKWYPMMDWENKPIADSKLLACFQLLTTDQAQVAIPNIQPPTIPMFLEVTTLGLRDLTSTLGINKTYIHFDLPTATGRGFKTNPSCKPSAHNPNFLQVLQMPVHLPTDSIFAPSVEMGVHNILFGGFINRLVGTASLDLGRWMVEDPENPGKWKAGNEKSLQSSDEMQREINEEAFMKKLQATKAAAEKYLQDDAKAEMSRKKSRTNSNAAASLAVVRDMGSASVASSSSTATGAASTLAPPPTTTTAVAGTTATTTTTTTTTTAGSGASVNVSSSSSLVIPATTSNGADGSPDITIKGPDGARGSLMDIPEDDTTGLRGRDMRSSSVEGGDSSDPDQTALEMQALRNTSDTKGGEVKSNQRTKSNDDTKSPLLASETTPRGGANNYGRLNDEKNDEKQPILSEHRMDIDNKIDSEDFKELPNDVQTYNADEEVKGNELDDLPPYMKGRLIIDNELEDQVDCSPFLKIDLHTGQKNAGIGGKKYRKVGQFKGLVRLTDNKNEKSSISAKELLVPQALYLRLYILRGIKMVPKDDDGFSDPYLIIKLGDTVINQRAQHLNNTNDPEFFEAFEIPCKIPGDATLQITVMDWDGIGDDLIGTTSIDIEDRWFSKSWRGMEPKPVERRTLHNPRSSFGQGKLEMWMELIDPNQSKKLPMVSIKPPPPTKWEVRVIVWGCRDVPIMDETTEQNDLYITCECSRPGLKAQSTDTHLRSKKGKGNFNWRMKFPVELPIKTWPRLRFSIWDRDFFSANDAILEATIPLKGLCKRAIKTKDRVKILVKGKDRFWLEHLTHPNFGEKKLDGNPRMEISVEILPETMAINQLPAGFGRGDPNINPTLPPPEGRVKWSLFHPLDMLRELLGDNIYRKLCCIIWCSIFIVFLVELGPMIIGNLISLAIRS